MASAGDVSLVSALAQRAQEENVVLDVVLKRHSQANKIRLALEDCSHRGIEVRPVAVRDKVCAMPGFFGGSSQVLQR